MGKGKPERNYRGVLPLVDDAVAYFSTAGSKEPLAFVTHLGDIVDDYNSGVDDGATTMSALSTVMQRLSALRKPQIVDTDIKYLIGNHEMYNFSRQQLRDGVATEHGTFRCANAAGEMYYSWVPAPGWRMVVLDPYVESVHAGGRGSGLDEGFTKLICELNQNVREKMENDGAEARRLGTIQCNYFKGIEGVARRFCPFNGGLGATQVAWLKGELSAASERGERVILLCHIIFHPEASRPPGNEDGVYGKTLLWDYDQVLELLRAPEGQCVVACFHGHQHEGGFHTDEFGIHHIVFEAPLFGPAYAIVELDKSSLTLRGFRIDSLPSVIFPGGDLGVECCRKLQLRQTR